MELVSRVFRFADVEVREREISVVKGGEALAVEPKAFRVLLFLLEHPHKLITKDELLDAVWSDCNVSEHSLSRSIALLRRILGDDAHDPRYIETVATVGYRFVCDVCLEGEPDGAEPVLSQPSISAPDGESGPQGPGTLAREDRRLRRWIPALSVAGVALLVFIGAWVWFVHRAGEARAGPAQQVSTPRNITISPVVALPGHTYGPALSPDGRELAFFWNAENPVKYDLYVQLTGGGQPLRLTHTVNGEIGPARWSPDGTRIAFGRCGDDGASVNVVPALGGRERVVTTASCVGNWPEWTADGDLLVADACEPGANDSIVRYSQATGQKTCLYRRLPGQGRDAWPVLSPDGKTVAFLRFASIYFKDIYTVPVGGGTPRKLTQSPEWLWDLMWSADGKRLVFQANHNGLDRTWSMAATGGPIDPEMIYPRSGALSRDGRRLAYVDRYTSAFTGIWRVELAGEGGPVLSQKAIITAPRSYNIQPELSNDGRHLVFFSDRSGHPQIWKADSDGSNLEQLTSFDRGVPGSPRWSPDDRTIVFDAYFDNYQQAAPQIYTMDSEGRNVHAISSGADREVVPGYSRDGASLYFACIRSGRQQIWKRDLVTGKETQITRDGGIRATESVDGRTLFFTKFQGEGSQLMGHGIWSVPVTGGQPRPVVDAPHLGYWGHYAVSRGGIYFTDTFTDPGPTIFFYSFATGRSTPILTLQESPVGNGPGLTASRDGRTLYFSQVQINNSILMAENLPQ